jgi:hypothetical protein
MLDKLTAWLKEYLDKFLSALVDVLKDVFIWIIDTVGAAIVALVGAIPVPASISSGLQPLFDDLPQGAVYLIGNLGLPEGLAMIGAAFIFRFGRKLVTLFQW